MTMSRKRYRESVLMLEKRIAKPFATHQQKMLTKVFKKAIELAKKGKLKEAVKAPNSLTREQRDLIKGFYFKTAETIGEFVRNTSFPGVKMEQKDVISEAYWDAVDDYVSMQTAKQVTRMNATSRMMIKDVIDEGMKEGLGNYAIAEKLQEKLLKKAIITKVRAELIARTEVHNCSGYSANEMAKAIPVIKEKSWEATFDDRTREEHEDVDDSWIDYEEHFYVGGEKMEYPGDSSASARNLCNCRCVCLYRERKGDGR